LVDQAFQQIVRRSAASQEAADLSGMEWQQGLWQKFEMEPQAGVVLLGAIAGDAVVVFRSFSSPALASKRIIPADALPRVLTLR
jgi:hypothetical protein